MRILFIYPGYPPEEQLGGGISTYAKEAAEALSKQKHEVTVLSRTENKILSIEIINNVKIIRIPGNIGLSKFFPLLKFNKLGIIFYSLKIRKIIKKMENEDGNFDVIECGDWGAESSLLLDLYKQKLIIRCHTPSFISEKYNTTNPPYLSAFIKFLEKRVLQNTNFISSPSISLIKEIRKELSSKGQISIHPYPLATHKILSKIDYQTSFDKMNPIKIVVVGRLEERKGQDIVCRAFNKLCAMDFPGEVTFIGNNTPCEFGTYKDYLKRTLSAKAKSSVIFLGHLPREKILKIYRNYDVYIMASRFESLGFVVLEAMCAGIPVIASNVCEMPRLIDSGKTGFLFAKEDDNKLKNHLVYFLNNPKSIRRMGKMASKQILHDYGKDKSIIQILKYYKMISENNLRYDRKN